jgi:hypothetical protein
MSDWSDKQKAVYRYLREHKTIGEEQLRELEALGMVPRDQLKDRASYWGVCRNANVAMWVETPGWPSKTDLPSPQGKKGPCFYHMREKFNDIYVERINHPADDDGFDLFVPLLLIGADPNE